ncbi:MAG: hypothetical protein ISR77_37135 [Pirellulaceae bacterium]|nr:hypothetical protein [Pirellulaceae bacterium]
MTDILQRGSDWLQDQRHKHATRTVTYERGVDTVDLAGTIGRTIFEIDNGHGLLERIESRDYLVLAIDLVLGGSLVLPQRGDRIREAQNGTTYVYEVMSPGKEPHWRWSDPYRKTLRIHTKQIDVESP